MNDAPAPRQPCPACGRLNWCGRDLNADRPPECDADVDDRRNPQPPINLGFLSLPPLDYVEGDTLRGS